MPYSNDMINNWLSQADGPDITPQQTRPSLKRSRIDAEESPDMDCYSSKKSKSFEQETESPTTPLMSEQPSTSAPQGTSEPFLDDAIDSAIELKTIDVEDEAVDGAEDSDVELPDFSDFDAFLQHNRKLALGQIDRESVNKRKSPFSRPTGLTYQHGTVAITKEVKSLVYHIKGLPRRPETGLPAYTNLKKDCGLQSQYGHIHKTSPLMPYVGDGRLFEPLWWRYLLTASEAHQWLEDDNDFKALKKALQNFTSDAAKQKSSAGRKEVQSAQETTTQGQTPLSAPAGAQSQLPRSKRPTIKLKRPKYKGSTEKESPEDRLVILTEEDVSFWDERTERGKIGDEDDENIFAIYEKPDPDNCPFIGGQYTLVQQDEADDTGNEENTQAQDPSQADTSEQDEICEVTVISDNWAKFDNNYHQVEERDEDLNGIQEMPYTMNPFGEEHVTGFPTVSQAAWEAEYDLWDRGYIDKMWQRPMGCPYRTGFESDWEDKVEEMEAGKASVPGPETD